MFDFYNKTKERMIRYAMINTTSMPNSGKTPSTECQFHLARILKDELIKIGARDVYLDETNCLVYAKIHSNIDKDVIKVGFIAHLDTSPDVSGENVKPWVLENYRGGDIIIGRNPDVVMREEDFPVLKKYHNQDLIFSDGTTLLGGDDKAAISSIMTFIEYLNEHKEIKHGEIDIAFTPDEEVGGLAKDLDFNRFGAQIAYTVDGDSLGVYSDETFNAIEAQLTITGKNVHPGTAKGIMKNSIMISNEIINMLPENEKPETTSGREGFYHPHYISGNVESTKLYILLRDHDYQKFEDRKEYIRSIVNKLNKKYGDGTIELEYKNGYSSMKRVVDKYPYMINELVESIKDANVNPVHLAFRGGTDGSSISSRGLPCPNISAGYENAHSKYEFVSINSMVKNVEILTNLVKRLSRISEE